MNIRRSSAFVLGLLLAGATRANAGETESIYGIHDPAGAHLLTDNGGPGGYVLHNMYVGDGTERIDHADLEQRGVTVIVRLNYHDGTVPAVGVGERFARNQDYAAVLASVVKNSRGVRHWVIGNETNFPREWPRDRYNRLVPLGVERYASLYVAAYDAIKAVQPDSVVMPGAVGVYAGVMHSPDFPESVPNFIDYFSQLMTRIQSRVDALAFHAYTHGPGLDLIEDESPMQTLPSIYNFRVYRTLHRLLPAGLRDNKAKPIYITETDQSFDQAPDEYFDAARKIRYAWHNERTRDAQGRGWVQRVYDEVAGWNATHVQKIRTAIIFRYEMAVEDTWTYGIQLRSEVLQDFREAVARRQRWSAATAPPPPPGTTLRPDLVIESLEVTPGSPPSLTAIVKNAGRGPTPPGKSVGVLARRSATPTAASSGSVPGPLAAGATARIPLAGSALPTTTPSTFSLIAWADASGAIAESDETNNVYTGGYRLDATQVTSPASNLVIESLFVSKAGAIRPGDALSVVAIVKNRGQRATPAGVPIGVGYQVDGRSTWGVVMGPLVPGATLRIPMNGPPLAAWAAGYFRLVATVDDVNRIAEEHETDNQAELGVLVESGTASAPARPDLIIESIGTGTAKWSGDLVRGLSVVVRNRGGAATPSGTVIGVGCSVGGAWIWGTRTAPLGPGLTATILLNAGAAPPVLGTAPITITATVDDVNRIVEADENNNSLSTTLRAR